jgi:cytochrome b561
MFALPLSGWAYSNAAGYPIVYLGLLPLPNLLDKNQARAQWLLQLHQVLGWLLLATLTAHVAAAIKHHFVDRDDTLRRILFPRAST